MNDEAAAGGEMSSSDGLRRSTVTRMARSFTSHIVRIGALSAALLLAATACGDSDSDAVKADTSDGAGTTTTVADGSGGLDLDGKVFIATGAEGYTPVEGSDLTLTFDGGRLTVNGGCNTMGGDYEVTDGTLAWTGMPMSTEMGCADDLMAQDQWLSEFFTTGVEAALVDDTLTLTQDEVTITLEAQSDAPLEGTAWSLQSLISGETASSLPADVKTPTLTIAEDGTVSVFTGCNNGRTTVEIAETTLTFDVIASTRMACDEASMALEHTVTTILDGEVSYTLDGSTLTIDKDGEGLVFTATEG